MNDRNKKFTKLGREIEDYVYSASGEHLDQKGKPEHKVAQVIKLQNAWEKIASPRALEHTDNITFVEKAKKPGVLIYVENSHWAAELEAQKELYRLLLEQETGFSIPDIRFLVTREASYKKIFLRRKEKNPVVNKGEKPIPLTAKEEEYVRRLISQVSDSKLKEKLYNAMKADLEWKKGTDGLKLPENSPESPETI